jgi:drug/metabolite transporter (DMT)-like permease
MSKNAELKAWMTLCFLSIIWGTSFILIKKSLIVFTPIQVAILRIAISGVAFTPFFIYHLKRHEWHRWWMYVIIALTGSAIPAILYATAQTQISSATSGILNSVTPIFALIIGVNFFGKHTNRRQIFGIVLGFIGACALILLDSSVGSLTGQLLYGSLVVIGAIFYATNVNLVKEYFQEIKPMNLSSFAFFMIGIPAILIVPFTDIPYKLQTNPDAWQAFGYLTILAVVSTVMALYVFYKLVQDTSAVFGASVSYLIPIVALIWGFWDGEPIGIWHMSSLAVIICGVYLIRERKPS